MSVNTPPTVDQLVQFVSERMRVDATSIRDMRLRHPRVVAAREAVVYLARCMTFTSFTDLTYKMYATHGHATCMYQWRRAVRHVGSRTALGLEYEALEQEARTRWQVVNA